MRPRGFCEFFVWIEEHDGGDVFPRWKEELVRAAINPVKWFRLNRWPIRRLRFVAFVDSRPIARCIIIVMQARKGEKMERSLVRQRIFFLRHGEKAGTAGRSRRAEGWIRSGSFFLPARRLDI